MQTEFEFNLPRGLMITDGQTLKTGIMRLATAKDEITAVQHPKVRQNPDYLSLVVLSKVIQMNDKKLEPEDLERLFTADLNYLQNLYESINSLENPNVEVTCPYCAKTFSAPIFNRGE